LEQQGYKAGETQKKQEKIKNLSESGKEKTAKKVEVT